MAVFARLAAPTRRGRPTAPMRWMPPIFPRPDPARSKAGCRPPPTPIFRRSPIRPAWSNPFNAGRIEHADQPIAQRRRLEHQLSRRRPRPTWFRPGSENWAFHFTAGGSFDALTGENLTAFAVSPRDVPAFRNHADQHQWRLAVGPHGRPALPDLRPRLRLEIHRDLQWTIEAFGQAGASDIPSVVRPRFQTGVRYRPNEIFSVDLIYGHNITGENANWITVGTTIRFPVPEGKPARERTGHL